MNNEHLYKVCVPFPSAYKLMQSFGNILPQIALGWILSILINKHSHFYLFKTISTLQIDRLFLGTFIITFYTTIHKYFIHLIYFYVNIFFFLFLLTFFLRAIISHFEKKKINSLLIFVLSVFKFYIFLLLTLICFIFLII